MHKPRLLLKRVTIYRYTRFAIIIKEKMATISNSSIIFYK